MRTTLIKLATAHAHPIPLSLAEASTQIVPPIPLYRRLLRAHRKLPPDMRFMGDSYIKSEFRLTRKADNALHILSFLTQWKVYLDELEDPATKPGEPAAASSEEFDFKGKRMTLDTLNRMSTEQVGQLYELMHATRDVWKTPDELQAAADTEAADLASNAGGDKKE